MKMKYILTALAFALLFPAAARAAEGCDEASVDALVALLGHKDYAVREDATEKLLAMGGAADAALRKALRSDDAEIRWRAEAILMQLSTTGSEVESRVRAVLSRLSRTNRTPEVEEEVYRELAQMKEDAAGAVIKMLKEYSRDYNIFQFICAYLNAKGAKRHVPAIVDALLDGEQYMYSQLSEVAFRIDREKALELLAERLKAGTAAETKRVLEIFYIQFAEEFAALAKPYVKSDNPEVKLAALRVLSRSGSASEFADIFREALASKEPQIKYIALQALAALKDEKALEAALEMVKDPKLDINWKINSLWALSQFRGDAVKQAFLDILNTTGERDQILRTIAAQNLANIKEDWCLEIARKLLDNPRPEMRCAAVWVIHNMGDRTTLGRVKELLSDNSLQVVADAIDVLADNLDNKDEALGLVRPFVKHSANYVASRAISALGRLRLKGAVDAIIEALDSNDQQTVLQAQLILQNITGRDFGILQPGASAAGKRSLEEWKKWWRENRESFMFR
jgi:HEAT repeat protein